MENNYGPVRVYSIKMKDGTLRLPLVLENVDLSADVFSQIIDRLEAEENINGVKTFEWEIVEPGDEETAKIEKIKAVLRRYFEVNDDGDDNPEYDENFTSQLAIDEIHDIVGTI